MTEPRTRLHPDLFVGRVNKWKGGYGWIEPLEPIDHPRIQKGEHEGHLFVHATDVELGSKQRETDDPYGKGKGGKGGSSWGRGGKGGWAKRPSLREGVIVEFYLYEDSRGLGAECVSTRQVIRTLIPVTEARRVFGDDEDERAMGVREFEDRNDVVLRAFEWYEVEKYFRRTTGGWSCWYNLDNTVGTLPLLIEIWGRPKSIVAAVDELKRRLFCHIDFLVPASRVDHLNLAKLMEQSGCEFQMSNLPAIDDPMACYPLNCRGDSTQVGHAVLGLIEQICDQ